LNGGAKEEGEKFSVWTLLLLHLKGDTMEEDDNEIKRQSSPSTPETSSPV